MKKFFGLDLGAKSIGWAIINKHNHQSKESTGCTILKNSNKTNDNLCDANASKSSKEN